MGTWNRLTAVTGKWYWGLVEKVKGIKHFKKTYISHRHRQQFGDSQRNGGVAIGRGGQRWGNGDGKGLCFG